MVPASSPAARVTAARRRRLDEEHETRRVAKVAVGVLTVDAMVFVLPAVRARLRGSTFPSFPLRDSGSPFPDLRAHSFLTSGRARPKKIAKANAHTRRRRRVANSPNPDPQRVNGISIPRRRFETHGPLVSQPPRKLYSGSFCRPHISPTSASEAPARASGRGDDELFGCPHCPTRATAARSQLVSSQASRRARRSHLRSPLARARGEGRSFARRLWRSSGRPGPAVATRDERVTTCAIAVGSITPRRRARIAAQR